MIESRDVDMEKRNVHDTPKRRNQTSHDAVLAWVKGELETEIARLRAALGEAERMALEDAEMHDAEAFDAAEDFRALAAFVQKVLAA